jgi:hypothetical protein
MANTPQGAEGPRAAGAPGSPAHKVAILVVHGVAAKQAGQSTDQVADLLTSLRLDSDGDGYALERRAEFLASEDPSDIPKLIDQFGKKPGECPPAPDESYDHLVMREALENYAPRTQDLHFHTYCNIIRRERVTSAEKKPGHAGADPKPDETELHIYECHWADLSHGGSYGFLRRFVEFYQFVLDLCSLGRTSLASLDHTSRERKFRFPCRAPLQWTQTACEFLITGTIPVINILLICLLLFSPILSQNADFLRWFFPVLTGFLSVVGTAYGIGPRSQLGRDDPRRKNWFWYAIVAGLALSLLAWWIFNTPSWDQSRTMRLATICGWGLIMAALTWWAGRLRAVRPYLALNFRLALPLSGAVLLWAIGRDPLHGLAVGKRALLHLAEVLMAVGQLAWFAYFFLAAALVVISGVAMKIFRRIEKNPDRAANDVGSLQTLRISTSLAGLLILLVTLCTWQIAPLVVRNFVQLAQLPAHITPASPPLAQQPGAADAGLSAICHGCMDLTARGAHAIDGILRPTRQHIESLTWGRDIVAHFFPCTTSQNPQAYADPRVVDGLELLLRGCRYNQIYCVVLALLALLLVVVLAFWPVIERESNPPPNLPERNPPPPKTGTNETPAPLPWGLPLNEAFRTLEQVGWFVSWGIIFGASLSILVLFALGQAWEVWEHQLRFPGFLVICGVLLLAAVAKVFGPMLAVTLDVINWLRERPAGNTPRSRIVARFLAMLSVISRVHEQQRYDKFIIVAHSQGTVIAVETLRALYLSKTIRDDAACRLHKLPEVTLFTMGCPLVQLYARRFPHLFDWALDPILSPRHTFDPSKPNPNPTHLYKLKQWINVYGAMDYVGRALWLLPQDDQPYLSQRLSYWNGQAIEFCLGDIAHNHYWDTGSPVARHLHEMIESETFPSHPEK